MANPKIKGIPPVSKYAALATFGANVVTAMTAAVAIYATPNPTLVSITAAVNGVDANYAVWGPAGTRGSHADLLRLRASAFNLRALLIQLAGYVVNTVVLLGGTEADQAANMALSGFSVKNLPTPQGLLAGPENFHQWFLARISIFHVGLKWSKPIGLSSPGNVKLYQVYRNTINVFNSTGTTIIGTATRTSFIDTTVTPGSSYFYWITAANDQGSGAPTASLSVTIPN